MWKLTRTANLMRENQATTYPRALKMKKSALSAVSRLNVGPRFVTTNSPLATSYFVVAICHDTRHFLSTSFTHSLPTQKAFEGGDLSYEGPHSHSSALWLVYSRFCTLFCGQTRPVSIRFDSTATATFVSRIARCLTINTLFCYVDR